MSLKFYSKFFIALFALLGFACVLSAQYNETFESVPTSGQTFTSNGQGFTLTNALTVVSSGGTEGFNNSAKFVANMIFPPATNQTSSIRTDGSTIINVDSLRLFVSSDNGATPTSDGSVIFVGKLAGATQFTVTKTTGFAPNMSLPGNGFGLVNFATDFVSNVSNTPIDELELTLQGNFNYLAIDNFTWSLGVLPVNLVSFTAILQNNKAIINWRTAGEINNSHFTIEKSTNGTDFTLLKTIQGKGNYSNPSDYSVVDEAPENGINYYRLKQYDFDGRVKDHGVRTVTFNGNSNGFRTYPNPVINNVFTLETKGAAAIGQVYKIIDISGRVLITGRITQNIQPINISDIQKGMFILQLTDGRFIKLVKN